METDGNCNVTAAERSALGSRALALGHIVTTHRCSWYCIGPKQTPYSHSTVIQTPWEPVQGTQSQPRHKISTLDSIRFHPWRVLCTPGAKVERAVKA